MLFHNLCTSIFLGVDPLSLCLSTMGNPKTKKPLSCLLLELIILKATFKRNSIARHAVQNNNTDTSNIFSLDDKIESIRTSLIRQTFYTLYKLVLFSFGSTTKKKRKKLIPKPFIICFHVIPFFQICLIYIY